MNNASFDYVGAEIIFQRRNQYDVSFDRLFEEYETGFGDFCGTGDLWLGLKKLHELTKEGKWHLRLSMRTVSNYLLLWCEYAGTVCVILKMFE